MLNLTLSDPFNKTLLFNHLHSGNILDQRIIHTYRYTSQISLLKGSVREK